MVRRESVIVGYFAISMCIFALLFTLLWETNSEEGTVQSEYVTPEVSIVDIEGIMEMTEDSYVVVTNSGKTMELPFHQTIECKSDIPMQPYVLVDKDAYTTLYQIHHGPDPIPVISQK